MLTGKQKRFLRKEAHHYKPIFQVGKSVVTKNMIAQVTDTLEKRELIKVNVLQNCLENKESIAHQLATEAHAEVVQIIGKQIILYKKSFEHQTLQLPE